MSSPLRFRLAPLVCLSLAACTDGPTGVRSPEPQPSLLASIQCRGDRVANTIQCSRMTPAGASGDLIVGGQGTYVQLTSSFPSYNSDTERFSFFVTVQNLIPQPMGTTDGTTPTVNGVRVFFAVGPTVTGGSGSIDVVEDGTDSFTASNQSFIQYAGSMLGADQVLSQNETSEDKLWELAMPPSVTTFTFVLYVAAEVPFPNGFIDVSPPADTMAAGGAQALTGTVRSAVGNVIAGQTISWGTSDPGVATVDGSGNVTGVGPGTATITATSGARSGSATVAVCPNLALGGVYVADMPAGASLCLAGAAEYTVVPVNLSDAASVLVDVTGSGIVSVSGPPSPIRLPAAARFSRAATGRGGGLVQDYAFEDGLRRRERRELAGRPARPARSAPAPRRAITPGVPAVGALMTLNVETDNACSTFDNRTGRVMAVGTNIIVMEDTMNPSGGLSASDYQAIADSFDTFIHPVVTGNFGTPSDIDGNGRVIAFYTRAVNELTPPASSSFVGGFVFSRDLYPIASCPTSNVGEMFYMLAADPSGDVNGNVRSVSFVLGKTYGTLGHEFEHLINASRRMHINTPWNGDFEEVWLDEGLAHVAEELIFYSRAGLSPGGNLGVAQIGDGGVVENAFFNHAESNFGRLRQWLLNPEGQGPFQTDDDLGTRGAAWAFLRYAADRTGGTQSSFWSDLVNTGETGLTNLETALGTAPEPWIRDFTAAMYGDDAGIGVAATYTQPSWNFRQLYQNLDYDPGPACSCAYELDTRDPASGVAESITLSEGGAAAYLRLGVSAGAFAGVTITSGGGAPPGTVRLAVIRRE